LRPGEPGDPALRPPVEAHPGRLTRSRRVADTRDLNLISGTIVDAAYHIHINFGAPVMKDGIRRIVNRL
jgi:hypothetical protein